jgi:hypothetical protein
MVSSKGKIVVKPKLIDLVAWITYSGTTGKDEVFSFRKKDDSLVHLTGRSVPDEI